MMVVGLKNTGGVNKQHVRTHLPRSYRFRFRFFDIGCLYRRLYWALHAPQLLLDLGNSLLGDSFFLLGDSFLLLDDSFLLLDDAFGKGGCGSSRD